LYFFIALSSPLGVPRRLNTYFFEYPKLPINLIENSKYSLLKK
jgi:hypothetical protein